MSDQPSRLYFLVMRGPTLAEAKPVVVSEDERLVRDIIEFAGDRLNAEADSVFGAPVAGGPLQLVRDEEEGGE